MFEKFIGSLGLAEEQAAAGILVINFYEEMLEHKSWKKRLLEYVDGRSKEKLEPGKVSMDSACELGKWLHSDGKIHFGEQPVFIKLVDEHAKFHAKLAKVVEAHQGGNKALALEILNGGFEEQTTRVVNCLTKFNAMVEADGNIH